MLMFGRVLGRSSRALQRGLSIVELLVGIAIGLFVVAAASMLTATHLGENRRMLLEAQVQQDLRAAADVITRELRRSGTSTIARNTVWWPGTSGVAPNSQTPVAPLSGTATNVTYSYARAGMSGPRGFRLASGKIESDLHESGVWQDLTDSRTLLITAFTVTARHVNGPESSAVQKLPCPKLCPDTTTDCWPTLQVREFQIDITGRAANDASVQRSVRAIVRPRTNVVTPDAAAICPA